MRSIFALAASTTLASAQQTWGSRLGCAVPVVKKQFDCRTPEPLPTIKQLAQEPQRCGCPMPPPAPVADPCPQQQVFTPPPPPVTPVSTGCGCQPVAPEPVVAPSCNVPVVREPITKEVCEDIQITKQRQVMKECKKVIMERQERSRTTQVPTTTYKTVMKKKTRTVYKTVNKKVTKTRMVPKKTFTERKVCRPGNPIPQAPVPVAAPSCGCRQPAPVQQPACGCLRQGGRNLQNCSCPQAPIRQPQCGCSAPVAQAPAPVQMAAPICDIQKIEKVIMVPETYEEDCPTQEAVTEEYEEPCKVPSTVFTPKVEKYWVNCPKTVTEQCPSTENYTVTEKKCRTVSIAQEPLPVAPVPVAAEPQACNQCGCCQPARQQQNMCGGCNSQRTAPTFLNEQEDFFGSGSTTNGWQLAP